MLSRKGLGAGALVILVVLSTVGVISGLAFVYNKFLSVDISKTEMETCLAKTGYAWDNGRCIPPSDGLTPSGELSGCISDGPSNPEVRLAVRNINNETGTEYLTGTAYVFEGRLAGDLNIPADDYVTSFTLVNTGLPVVNSGIDLDCDKWYTVIVPASDGATVSVAEEWFQDQTSSKVIMDGSAQGGLLFRVYDEENKGYVYTAAETTAGNWIATGATAYSTTGNSTGDSGGWTVAANGGFDYSISMKTNATAASDSQFGDSLGRTLIGVDIQTSEDWQEPQIAYSFRGVGKEVVDVDCPTKISNDGSEFCYSIENRDGTPVVLPRAFEGKLRITGTTLSAVDADDDVVVRMYTEGYKLKTTEAPGMLLASHGDDSSRTAVYTVQAITLAFE